MPSDVTPLKEIIPQTSQRDEQKVRIMMLGETTSSFLKTVKRAAERRFEALLGSIMTRNCFPKKTSYFCDPSEPTNIFVAWKGAARHKFCVRCHSRSQGMLIVRESSSPMLAETMNTHKNTRKLQDGV